MYQYHPADPRYGALYHEHRQYLQQLQQECIQSQYNQTCAYPRTLAGAAAWSHLAPHRSPGDLSSINYCSPGNAPTAVATPSSAQTSASNSSCTTKDDEDGPRVASNLEKHVLAALHRLFVGKSFQKVRPSWLRNPRTNRLCELDFYNDELKLGQHLEVQGLQHLISISGASVSRSNQNRPMSAGRSNTIAHPVHSDVKQSRAVYT
jgi:hypothetical protein